MMVQVHLAPLDPVVSSPINTSQAQSVTSNNSSNNNFNNLIISFYSSYIFQILFLITLFAVGLYYAIITKGVESFLSGSFLEYQGPTVTTFFYPSWAMEFKTMTDIETLAIGISVAYPTAQYLIGLALWAVLIGIISITTHKGHSTFDTFN